MMNTVKTMREDHAWVRQSTDEQDNRAQIANVELGLSQKEVNVAKSNWHVTTVSRSMVAADPDFVELMDLVDAGKVGTIYVESADRWGFTDTGEFYAAITRLRKTGTRLFDLQSNKYLDDKEQSQELMNVIKTFSNHDKLDQTAAHATRSRAQNFKATGSRGSGLPPMGYGTACYDGPEGKNLWLWCATEKRNVGTRYHWDGSQWVEGQTLCRLPRKDERHHVLRLHPNIAIPDLANAIRQIFELYTNMGLSRRAISKRLNDQGITQYGKPWTHTQITAILDNQHYVGDSIYAKRRSGKFRRVGPNAEVIKPQDDKGHGPLKKDRTHEGLVSRKLWNAAVAKRNADKKRVTYPARRPEYYLRNLLVCGHCGKGMGGNCREDGTVFYVCSTYRQRKADGREKACGYHTIKHDEAERIIDEKLKQLEVVLALELPDVLNTATQISLMQERWEATTNAARLIASYLREPDLEELILIALQVEPHVNRHEKSSKVLRELKEIIADANAAITEAAKTKLQSLEQQHHQLVMAEVRADSEQQRKVIRSELHQIEPKIERLQVDAVGLVEKVEAIAKRTREESAKFKDLMKGFGNLQGLAKATAIKRVVSAVRFYWDTKHHPSEKTPSRPRTTTRKGRNSYHLQHDKTEWQFTDSDSCVLDNTW